MIEFLLDNHVFTVVIAVTAGVMAYCDVSPDIIAVAIVLELAGLTWVLLRR